MKEEQNINGSLNGWQVKKLGELCKPKEGLRRGPFGSAIKKEFFVPDGYKVYEQSNAIYDDVQRGRYFIDENKYAELINFNVVPGDLIVSCSGTLGRIAEIPLNAKAGVINQALLRIRLLDDIVSKKYFLYYFRSSPFQKKIFDQSQGTAMSNLIGIKDFKEIELNIPSIAEQRQIVSKIEELFSELDKGIEELKTAQQQLKVYRQAVLKWAFEGKLTEEWRSQQTHLSSAEKVLANIRKKKTSGSKSKELLPLDQEELNELFELPQGWQWEKNERYLFEVKDGTHDSPKYFSEGVPFVTQKNVREDGLDFSNVQYISQEDHNKFFQRSNVAKGDILISMIGHNRGMTAIVDTDSVFSIKNVGLFKFYPDLQYMKFSFYYYQSKTGLNLVLKKSKGGAQPFIGLTELRNWPVVVCSLEEQQQIVQEIESRLSVCDKIEETINDSLKQGEALRQSILKKAFEGKLS
jgi:type I restriction enzyme, S subunit